MKNSKKWFQIFLVLFFLVGCTIQPPRQRVTILPTATATIFIAPPTKELPTLPAVTGTPAADLAITSLSTTTVGLYDVLELDISTIIAVENPYDPEELDLRVRFTSPSGKEVDIGAFWYQDFSLKNKARIGEPGWKARFTPTETGMWTAIAHIPALGLVSEPVTFEVEISTNRGFIRFHPENPRYFAYDNGDFFFPIGMNYAWWCGTCEPLKTYQQAMISLHNNGGNTLRVWMARWSFAIEGMDTGLGNYDDRQKEAWLLDQVFKMAEERDIYIDLVLLNCLDFSTWEQAEWGINPYNQKQGGPLASPEEFATNPEAIKLFEQRLNYIINRWGYSPNLLAWEWWNEVNLTPIKDEDLIPWLQEVTAHLRERDVNRHLTTNSYAIKDRSPIWQLEELDIVQKHEYTNQIKSPNHDLGDRALQEFQAWSETFPPKPVILGEFGYASDASGDTLDKAGIHLHNGIWATTFAGYGGAGLYWFSDIIEQYNLWYHFKGLSRFIEDVDLSQYQPFTAIQISGENGKAGEAIGMGLQGEDLADLAAQQRIHRPGGWRAGAAAHRRAGTHPE